jgi:hypothetical protein
MKLFSLIFVLLLVVGVISLIVVAGNDEGMMNNNFIVYPCKVVVKTLQFPLYTITNFFKGKPFNGYFGLLIYFVNIVFWAVIITFASKYFRKYN